jgi:uncharacterized protein YbjT (DUF2867 family)
MKRVLVAGATGYLGGFVVREFKTRGYFVRALARSPKKLDHLRDSIDEVVKGEVTRPESIAAVCDGIDVVFSSVGVTKQKDGLTFKDVDFQGNKNLLDVALKARVKKFVYVSVLNGPNLTHLAIVKAHEDFVNALEASRMQYAVIRPSGFYSDMGEYTKMARKGRVYLFGDGNKRINPIHGADLAITCVDAVDGTETAIDVGGPEVLTHRQIAQLAFEALGKPPKISSIPVWLMRLLASTAKVFNRHEGELLAFLTTAMSIDAVAPKTGTRTLGAHFREACTDAPGYTPAIRRATWRVQS